jgi:hypothetical protein
MGSPLVVFAVTVVVAAAAAPVAAAKAPTKVRLNKINPLHRSTDLPSSNSISPTSRRLPVPCSSDPHPPQLVSASTSTLQPSILPIQTALYAALPRRLRLHLGLDLELHPLPPATASNLTFGRSAHASSPAPSPHLQPTLGAVFHLGACALGASMAPRRRIRRRQRLQRSCRSYPVIGPCCNLVFLGGPLCKMAA